MRSLTRLILLLALLIPFAAARSQTSTTGLPDCRGRTCM